MRRPVIAALVLLAPLVLFGADDARPKDDTAALQALLDSPGDFSTYRSAGVINLEPRTYRISDTLLIKRRSVALRGQGISATDGGGTTLLWTGPPGKPMLRFTEAMHCEISNLRLAGNSQAKPSAAISFLESPGNVCPVEGNMVRNVWIGAMLGWDADAGRQFANGLLFEGADQNDDFTCFDNLTIYQCDAGIRVSNPMNVGDDFRNIRIYQCDIGAVDNSRNSYSNVYMGNVLTCFSIQRGGSMNLVDFQAEDCGRMAVFDGYGGSLTVKGGSFQCGAKFAPDGIAIDGYTPSPVTVSLEDFGFSSIGATAAPKVRLRSDPAGAEGRKTFLGYNLVNFDASNLDMAIAGPAAQYPGAQRFIAFNRRGMHNSPGSLPAAEYCNRVGPGGTVDLNRYDLPVLPKPAPGPMGPPGPPGPQGPEGPAAPPIPDTLQVKQLRVSGSIDFGDGRKWTPEGLWLDTQRFWIADGLYPGGYVKWAGSGGLGPGENESLRFVGWSVDAHGNRRSGFVVPPLKGK